jgi:hypothetical protein
MASQERISSRRFLVSSKQNAFTNFLGTQHVKGMKPRSTQQGVRRVIRMLFRPRFPRVGDAVNEKRREYVQRFAYVGHEAADHGVSEA